MISPTRPRERILIVGAGRRVQNNFLPALACLQDIFEVRGIHSRTHERLSRVAEKWAVPVVESIKNFDLSSIDVVAISVPTAQNAIVLQQLMKKADSLRIVIDTPIAWTPYERAESLPLLQKFQKVTVAEDYMNFPQFELVRQAVRSGLVGRVRRMTLNNIGYLYHGLALIRSFGGFGPVVQAPRIVLGSNAHLVSYECGDDFVAHVIGPYRRHSCGGLSLEGQQGFISEFPIDRDASSSKPTYILSATRTDGRLTGFNLAGKDYESSVELPDLLRMSEMNFSDKTEMNLVRGCGLIEVLRSAAGVHNINASYGFANAYYDSVVSTRADQGLSPLDPFISFPHQGSTACMAHMRWTSTTRTFLKQKPLVAASLQPGEKMEIPEGMSLTASEEAFEEGHVKLTNVQLQGKALDPTQWYLFQPHWAR